MIRTGISVSSSVLDSDNRINDGAFSKTATLPAVEQIYGDKAAVEQESKF